MPYLSSFEKARYVYGPGVSACIKASCQLPHRPFSDRRRVTSQSHPAQCDDRIMPIRTSEALLQPSIVSCDLLLLQSDTDEFSLFAYLFSTSTPQRRQTRWPPSRASLPCSDRPACRLSGRRLLAGTLPVRRRWWLSMPLRRSRFCLLCLVSWPQF